MMMIVTTLVLWWSTVRSPFHLDRLPPMSFP